MPVNENFDEHGFCRDLRDEGLEERLIPIEVQVSIADKGRRWSQKFLAEATEKAKKDYLRKLNRRGIQDEDGRVLKFLGIEEADPKTGEYVPGYKQVEFFTLDNWEWAIRDCKKTRDIYDRKFKTLCRLAANRYGERAIQGRFEFKLPFRKSVQTIA